MAGYFTRSGFWSRRLRGGVLAVVGAFDACLVCLVFCVFFRRRIFIPLFAVPAILSAMTSFRSQVLHRHKHSAARVLKLSMPHGDLVTPVFMPVATRAGVNNMMPAELI